MNYPRYADVDDDDAPRQVRSTAFVPPGGRDQVSMRLLKELQRESARAHVKHVANGMSLLGAEMLLADRVVAVGEEYGEVCRALTKDGWRGLDHLRKELLQLANTAASWAQAIDDHRLRAVDPTVETVDR